MAARLVLRIRGVRSTKPNAAEEFGESSLQNGAAETSAPPTKKRSARNKTLQVGSEPSLEDATNWELDTPVSEAQLRDRIICADTFATLPHLPPRFVDLLILDPPYNLTKNYDGKVFRERSCADYAGWFARLLLLLQPTLKPDASIYVCADWQTSLLVAPLLNAHFHVRNRITWAREKGRGASTNWKSAAEDIWFCTAGSRYYFDVSAVKLRKKVRAPYRSGGRPKDWEEDTAGRFRLTHPSNVWTDLTVPFWSMAENTEHPTQKPEKLMARLLLASSKADDMVFDPFLGSGTSAVVAKKLGRRYLGIEAQQGYCALSSQRLSLASEGSPIQGYRGGVFWERNS